MDVVQFRGRPPVWDDVERYTGLQWGKGIVFTYDGVIYSEDLPVRPDVEVHERVHVRQQLEYGSANAFMHRYFTDLEFRKKIEVEAYHEQYRHASEHYVVLPIEKKRYLERLAENLSLDLGTGPGGIYEQKISRKDALRAIASGILAA